MTVNIIAVLVRKICNYFYMKLWGLIYSCLWVGEHGRVLKVLIGGRRRDGVDRGVGEGHAHGCIVLKR